MRPLFAAALVFAAMTAPALAVTAQMQITIPGDVQHLVVTYECDDDSDPITVEYINAEPNFLAIVPVDGESRLFVNVISGSGARYAAGQYIWWNSGAEASFYDEIEDPDGEPLFTCIEFNDAP